MTRSGTNRIHNTFGAPVSHDGTIQAKLASLPFSMRNAGTYLNQDKDRNATIEMPKAIQNVCFGRVTVRSKEVGFRYM
jgi:hypothetical protein